MGAYSIHWKHEGGGEGEAVSVEGGDNTNTAVRY